MNTLRIGVVLGALCASGYVFAEKLESVEKQKSSELCYVQVDSLKIPVDFLKKAVDSKSWQATFSDSVLYSRVFRNGTQVWQSPSKEIIGHNEQEFVFDNSFINEKSKNSFSLMWKPQDRITWKIYIAESDAWKRASNAAAGGLAGAVVGAGIGAAAGGIATAPTGAGVVIGVPAGAFIGGVIGFFGGAAVGSGFPVEGEREVISFNYDQSDSFNLSGKKKSNALEEGVLQNPVYAELLLSAKMLTTNDRKKTGELEPNEKYVVRIRSLYLNSKNSDVVNGKEYYLEINPTGNEKDLITIELGSLTPNVVHPLEIAMVLKNQGGDSSIRVYRKKFGKDACVFAETLYNTNGQSWLYLKPCADDFGSRIEMETFDVIK